MKIRIEGCTADELAEYSPYLSLGKVYEAVPLGFDLFEVIADTGEKFEDMVLDCFEGFHLPKGAKWVKVTE